MDRKKQIIRTSIVGIAVNVMLTVLKAFVGIFTNSIAVILDAVNNLSDALSSVITIVGAVLSGKRPDKKHPYGYGRIEYLSSAVVAVIVLVAGLTSLKESIVKIIHPEETSYTILSLVLISVGIIAKLACGIYVKSVGNRIKSGSLIASGTDAFFDAILSLSTLVAAILAMTLHIGLEGILGAFISAFIIKAGIGMLVETLSSIIGERVDKELAEDVKKTVCEFPGVHGAYDLTLHNYGPSHTIGSVHIELDDRVTARDIHKLSNEITLSVYQKFNIILTVGIYAKNNSVGEIAYIRSRAEEISSGYEEVLQMHGFFGDSTDKRVSFDLIIDFMADAQKTRAEIIQKLRKEFPNYDFFIVLDSDYSD